MARFGWDVFKIEYDNASGTPTDISADIIGEFNFQRNDVLEEVTAAGDDDDQHARVGLKTKEPLVLTCLYDDGAASAAQLFLGAYGTSTTRTFKVTWTTGETSSVETLVADIRRTARKGELSKLVCTLRGTGAVTEA